MVVVQVAEETSKNQTILYEQIKVLLESAYFILITYAITAAAFLFVMWDVVSHTILINWGVVFLLVLLIRATIHYFYHDKLQPTNAKRFAYYIVISLGITGLVWGIGVALMFPGLELGYQFFIMFIVAGIGGSAFSSNTIFLPGLYAFFPALLLPLAVRMFYMDETLYLAMGSVTIVFMSSLYFFSRNLNRSLLETLKLRFENTELVSQLRLQKEEAEHANSAKSKFLAAASHDLRQPLHALALFTSVLDEYIKTPKVRGVVEKINESVNALQNLFDALLDISQLDAGVMKHEKSNFDLQSILKKLSNEFTPLASKKGLLINWPESHAFVFSDPIQLEQILRNYISNAIRYTDQGEISITCETVEDSVNIQVIDTGIGIPKDQLENIYEEFHQLSNPERDRNKGLGLGLAIVRRTAKLLKHQITIKSETGKGSTFGITVERGEKTEVSQETAKPRSGVLQVDNEVLIIVIDDEASVREGMQRLFNAWGCDVIATASQEQALNRLKQQVNVPDAIIADYRLRDNMTGIEAIHAIYSEYNIEIPALIVTGDIGIKHLRNVSDSGFQVLHKPVAPLKLRTFIENTQLNKKYQRKVD